MLSAVGSGSVSDVTPPLEVEVELLAANPVSSTSWRIPSGSGSVDTTVVASSLEFGICSAVGISASMGSLPSERKRLSF